MPIYASLGCLALLLSLLISPVVRAIALRFGLVDKPDDGRKLHSCAIPRIGGIAVFVSYALSLLIAKLFASHGEHGLAVLNHPRTGWLMAALAIVFATGIIDDLADLRPIQKVGGQLAAAILAWTGGVQVHVVQDAAIDGWLSLPVTCLWLLLCTNAINLIDGLDGLATGMAGLSTLAIFTGAVLDHNAFLALMTIPLLGALLGFLRYNFNPASIFLGDSGSLTIGFILGCYGVLWSEKLHTAFGLLGPVIVVSLPLLDTLLSITRRFLRRRSIFSADRGHIHHRLLDLGKSPRQAALLLYAGGFLVCAIGLTEAVLPSHLAWISFVCFLVIVAVMIQYLGYLEFNLARRLLTRGVIFSLIDDHMHLSALAKSLRQATSPEEVLSSLRRTCSLLGFEDVSLISMEAYLPAAPRISCEVAIPLEHGNLLVLKGLPERGRPLALPELRSVLAEHFQTAKLKDSTLGGEVIPSPAAHSASRLDTSATNQLG